MKPYSLDLRQKIIDAYNTGDRSQRKLAKDFRVALSFVQKLLKRYRKTGSIAPKVRRVQTPMKLNSEQLNVLEEIVYENNDATLLEIREQLAKKTGVIIGRSTVARYLQKLNFTYKKKALYATEKRSEEVLQKRLEFWEQVRDIPAENLVFIDESGVNLALLRLFAPAPKGERARGERPQKKGKNVSIIGALALKGVIAQCNLMGSTDGLTFEAFVSRILVRKLWPGAVVILDNYSIHKGALIKTLIEEAGAKLIYLPPYSPEFNPIENYWSKLKSILRRIGARTYRDLVAAIEFALTQISTQDIRSWFAHGCYCR